jgi:hypothetical protein
MAAGLGFKTFTTGEVLTAADTNGYLMQGVLVFASSAARAAAVTSPQEGQYSYLKDTNSTEYYDGAAWIAAPIGDITGVTAGTGISGGGTSGTVTITNSMATEITAKGDLIAGTGSATFDNLAVGTNGQTLVADSTAATGLKYIQQGYTFISRTTFSAVSTQAIDNIFTSTYETYVVIIESLTCSTGGTAGRLQFRTSVPATISGSAYIAAFTGAGGAGVYLAYSTASLTYCNLPNLGNSAANGLRGSLTFHQVIGASVQPSFGGTLQNGWNGDFTSGGGFYNSTTTAAGIIFSAAAGTISGTVSVYGLAKA